MSKMSELDLTINELRSAAASLIAVADSLTHLFSDDDAIVTKQTPSKASPPVTLEIVRAALAEKSRQGKTSAVKELLAKYGANKLSEIAPENYSNLLSDAEEL